MSVRQTLRPDQEADLQKALALNGRLCLFSQPRTGKTRLALAITEALKCERVLLVGFNSFLPSWRYEMIALEESGNPFYLPFDILNTSTVLSRALAMREARRTGAPHMFAVNFESFWRSDLRQAIRDWKPDMVIYDEAHRLISRGTKAARFAHQIARDEKWFKHCLVLTATYQEHTHTDLFSLFKACNPDIFGLDFQKFSDDYTIVASHMCKTCGALVPSIKQLPRNAPACEPETGFHKGWFVEIKGRPVIGYKNEQELFDTIKRHSVRRTQEEVNILPPVNTIVPVKLAQNTREQYDRFMSTYVHQFQDKNNHALDVFARIALSALVKAQELTGGWIQDDKGNVLEISTEKLDLAVASTMEDLHNGKRPAVYCRFNEDVLRLAKALKIDPKWTYTSFAGNGDKGLRQREEILRQLLRGNLETLIGNGHMVSYGLNLSMMDTANFFSTSYSSIEFEQLCGRLQARGKKPFHRHFCAVDTVDEDIYSALSTKTELRLKVFGEQIIPFESDRTEPITTGDGWNW